MATIILKNQTAGRKAYGFVIVPASGQRSVTVFAEYLKGKDALLADIASGDIVVNDGTSDLNADQGRSLLVNPLDEQPVYVRGTGALSIPSGTIAERPSATLDGMIRYNSETNEYEVCDGAWKAVSVTSPKHDRQEVQATAGTSTSSQTYVDLDSMTLTTKDLGEAGTYNIAFSCVAKHTDKDDGGFVLNIGGAEEAVSAIAPKLSNNDETGISLTCQKSGLANGTVIKVVYKTVGATGSTEAFNRSLSISGVPDSTVVS